MTPHFAFYCVDEEGSAPIRQRLIAEHLAHIEANMGDFAVAGPLKDGDATIGSLLVIKASDEAEARQKFEADPYFAAGVWKSVQVSAFLGVAGEWVGGAAWKQ